MLFRKLNSTKTYKPYIILGIYASAQLKDKSSFWEHLLQLNNVIDVPWFLIGDFNELSNPNEKKGGQILHSNGFKRLNNFLLNIDT